MQKNRRTSISTLRGAARDGKDEDAAKVLKVSSCTPTLETHCVKNPINPVCTLSRAHQYVG